MGSKTIFEIQRDFNLLLGNDYEKMMAVLTLYI